MIKVTLSALLLVSAVAGAQTVTVGSTSSTTNGNTTTITVPVSVAVPPSSTTSGAALASLRVEAGTGNGYNVGQTFTKAFKTLILPNVVTDTASGWNKAANTYTVPTTGTYLIISNVRLTDSTTPGISYGQGVNTTAADNPSFVWATTIGTRNGFTNSRVMQLSAGQTVELFAYVDSSTPVAVSGASLSIQQIQ